MEKRMHGISKYEVASMENISLQHIVPFVNKPHMLYCPPSDSGILAEDWKNFVMSRLSVEFQKESEEQKERQRKNIYPHHISRRGYAGLREIMKDELTGDDEVDRAMLWKRARANKNGEFEGEILTRTISKIDEYTQQKKDGVFCKIHPTEDILTQALETPEHSGRVRAVGARVTPTIYFNLTKGMTRVGRSMQEMGKKVGEMNAKILELEAFIKSHFNKDVEKSSKSEKDSKGSCSVKNHDIQHIDDVIEVVDGYDSQKVKAHSPKAKRQKPPMSRTNNLITTDLPKILKLLYSYSRKVLINGSSIAMPLDDAVLGNYLTIYIFNEDVHNVCELLPISAACLCVYMWHLYKICASANLLGRIRFANPYDVSFSNNVDEDQRAGKVARRLIGALTNQLVLFPCNVGFHWILTVIDPHKEIVYLLDSLNHTNHDEQWKHAVNAAIKVFNSSISKKGRKNPKWVVIKCPLQPDSQQCGFYVMRYMKDIVDACGSKDSILLHSVFAGENYSKMELDVVRKEWAECIQDYVDEQSD